MADCARYRELVSGFADGALNEAEKIELDRHLEECASCRALQAVYEAIHADIEASAVEPPEGFSAGVMMRIRAMNQNASQNAPSAPAEHAADSGHAAPPDIVPLRVKKNKARNSTRTMVITLVAAAACLALVFVVSPQLFLGGSRSSSTAPDMKMHYSSSPAASAAPNAVPVEGAAEGTGQATSMKTADAGFGQADGSTAPPADNSISGTFQMPSATSAPVPSAMPAASAPTASAPADSAAAASPETQAMPSPVPKPNAWELGDYYAVITIKGPMPEIIASNARLDNGNGTFNIEVTIDLANQLLKGGYPVQMGAPDKQKALVIYSPS